MISPYLIAAVGVRQARRLAISTARIDAAEALRIGLVHEVAPEAKLEESLAALLAQLRSSGPGAVTEIKALYSKLATLGTGVEARGLTAATIARVRGTEEAR